MAQRIPVTTEWSLRCRRDPDAEALVHLMQSAREPALWERGVAEAREYLQRRSVAGAPGPDLSSVVDTLVEAPDGPVPVRVYDPGVVEPGPAVLYAHGGGWLLGGVTISDAFCRRLAAAAGCVVVSVDYRLAPEHPYPAGLSDIWWALRWVVRRAGLGVDPARLVLLGDSAGGNLVTVVARWAAEHGIAVQRQILAYPVVAGEEPFSAEHDVWPLTEGDRRWFLKSYVPTGVASTWPDIAPLYADSSALPPTTLLLAGCDPLFGQGLRYAEALIAAGVTVDVHVYPGQIHGFLTMDPDVLPTSRRALGVVVNAVTGGVP